MAVRIYKFKDIVEMQHFLNGGVVGGQANYVSGIVGKTLKLTLPSAKTVTFTAVGGGVNGDQTALWFKDIKTQIETAANDVKVSLIDGKIAIIEATLSGGVKVDKTGTATANFGFSTQNDTAGKVYNSPPSTTVPAWTFAYSGNDNSHIVFTLE